MKKHCHLLVFMLTIIFLKKRAEYSSEAFGELFL
jgi:hypothetical protein